MRRIVLLMTVATLVVVSALFVVSVAGAHKKNSAARTQKHPAAMAQHPAATAQKPPTRTVVIQDFRFKPAHIDIKRGTRVR
jgi:plastocyanin